MSKARTKRLGSLATLRKTLESSMSLPGVSHEFERTPFGLRMTPGAPWNIGWLEFAMPGKHFAVTRMELGNVLPSPQQNLPNASAANALVISLALEGSGSVGMEERVVHWQAPCCVVLTAGPQALPPPPTILAARRQRMVTVALPRGFLTQEWSLDSASLPDVLRGWEEGKPGMNLEILPMTPELSAIATGIMQCTLSGPLLEKYLESKVNETLCIIISGAARHQAQPERTLVLTPRDVERLKAAQAIVSRRFVTPPSLPALSREVGLNRNKLSAGFAAHFGITLNDYIRELRLNRALEMLRNDSGSVAEVALAVGYEHASNLSSALKKRYGLSPKQLRARKRVAL